MMRDKGRLISPMNPRLGNCASGPPHSGVFIPKRLVKKESGRKTTVNVVKILTERFWELARSVCNR